MQCSSGAARSSSCALAPPPLQVWDAAFTVIASRDRDLGLLLRLLFQTLFNFFTGMTVR